MGIVMEEQGTKGRAMSIKRTGRGFTLVEILIVVIILAVLAVIVIPLFANSTTDARKAALVDQLHQVRVQVQLYTLQHNDTRPLIQDFDWDDLITITQDAAGANRGPYMPRIPKNALNNFTKVLVVNADPSFGDAVAGADIGWVYNPGTGTFWATNTAANAIFNEGDLSDPNN
jgi:prepilin-type N-terminal cleavage/methylation domain-containing protein